MSPCARIAIEFGPQGSITLAPLGDMPIVFVQPDGCERALLPADSFGPADTLTLTQGARTMPAKKPAPKKPAPPMPKKGRC